MHLLHRQNGRPHGRRRRPGISATLAATFLAPSVLGAIAALGAAAGCSPNQGPPGSGLGSIERPVLERVDPGAKPGEIRLVERFRPKGKVAPWEVKAKGQHASKRIGEGEDGKPRFALGFDSWGKRRVAIPGEYDAGSFNRIALSGVFPGVFSISASLSGPDEAFFETGRMATVNTEDVQTVLFELPRRRRTDRSYDRLEFLILKGVAGFEIHSVDLLEQPLGLALPDPTGPGDTITIDHARLGVGLTSGDPVRTSFDATPGSVLYFAYGLPQALRVPGQKVSLTAELKNGETTMMRRYAIDSDIENDAKWQDASISLADLSGPTELSLSIHSEDGGALCALAELSIRRRGETAPSVVLVTSDTHRADHLGSTSGDLRVETPALDALAARGVLFEDCYSSTNVTSPSHVALMTATHPRDTRLVTNTAHLSSQAETLAERYREAGYFTVGVVSVRHLGPVGTGLGQGFDRMLAPISGTWDAEVAVDHLEEWLEDADGIPVFVWLHLFDAHHPYGPPGRFDRYYYPKNKDPFDESLPSLNLDPTCIPEDLLEVRDLEFPKAQYRGEISYLDQELGRLFENPRLSDSILAVTADHGEVLEKDGSYFNHASLYPDTLHIPLILAWPGGPAGLRVEQGVEQIDLGRTLLDLCGLEDVPFPGSNMVADLEGELDARPRFALAANASSASITIRPWHFVLYLRQYRGKFAELRLKHSYELYHLGNDPECLDDRVEEEPKRVEQLRRLLIEWLTSAQSSNFTTTGQQSAEAMDQLAQLGYFTATAEVSDEAWIDPECECEQCADF